MFVLVLSHYNFVGMTVTILISFFCKGIQFTVSLIFSLKKNGGGAPMVSLFSLVGFQAFLALTFYLKLYVELSNACLHGANYLIWIYSIYRGFIIYKIILF